MGTLGGTGANTRDMGHISNAMGGTTVGGGGMSDWVLGGGGFGRRDGLCQITNGMGIGGGSGPEMGQAAIGITLRRWGDGGEHAVMSHAQQPVRPFAGGGGHVGGPLLRGERRVHEGALKDGGVMNKMSVVQDAMGNVEAGIHTPKDSGLAVGMHGPGESCEAGGTKGNGFGLDMQRAGHSQDLMAIGPVNIGLSNVSGDEGGGLWFPCPAHPVAGAGLSHVPFGHWPSLNQHQAACLPMGGTGAMAQTCRLFS